MKCAATSEQGRTPYYSRALEVYKVQHFHPFMFQVTFSSSALCSFSLYGTQNTDSGTISRVELLTERFSIEACERIYEVPVDLPCSVQQYYDKRQKDVDSERQNEYVRAIASKGYTFSLSAILRYR